MAKKPEPKEEPTLSNLPMPQSDTPLVIDLPDGQKLVVGKLEEGSVIEVATWRGTGRPDSRTNPARLRDVYRREAPDGSPRRSGWRDLAGRFRASSDRAGRDDPARGPFRAEPRRARPEGPAG